MTRDRIRDDLSALGPAPGGPVMLPTRLSALGYVTGGPQAVIDRLLLGRARGQAPFAAIVGCMLAAGIGREGFVGAARSHLFDAAPALAFGVRWIEEHLNAPAD